MTTSNFLDGIDQLREAIDNPQIGPARSTIMHHADVWVTENSRLADCAFMFCRIYCKFPVNGPGKDGSEIMSILPYEEAFSPQFRAVFNNCTVQGCTITGTDEKPAESSGQ